MSIRRALALAALAAAVLWLLIGIAQAPDLFLYQVQAPEGKAERGEGDPRQDGESDTEEKKEADKKKLSPLMALLKELDQRMEDLAGAVSAYGVTGYAAGQGFGDGKGASASGGLVAVWGRSVMEPELPLLSGRQLYHEEIEAGARVAVIDERLAISLYRVGDPTGRDLVIGNEPFLVVGVTRHRRHAGEADEALARVPLKALDSAGVRTQVLSVQMRPVPGAGAYAAVSQGLKQWNALGSFHSLMKEKARAALPLRLLLCAAGLMLAALTLRLSRRAALALWRGGKEKLRSRYVHRLLPEFFARGLLILSMYALNLALIYLVLSQLIAPVYIFPEWVPTVLVEPKDILRTFWGLRAGQSALVALRTPVLIRLQFLHRLMTAACLALGALMLKPWYRLSRRLFPQED